MNKIFPFENLSEKEASARLRRFGSNELPRKKNKSPIIKIIRLAREPMILLLVATATVYLILGDLTEGLLLAGSVFVVLGISFYQEHKSERALEALKSLSSPRALVIRDGIERRLPATEIVTGDLVALCEGDRIPADGVILDASNFSVDESLLTGEALPSAKSCALKSDTSAAMESLDSSKKIFSSTLVVSGRAIARIKKTGAETEVGKIGKSLEAVNATEPALTKEIKQIVRLFAWSGAFICITIILVFGLKSGDWFQAILIGLAAEMALLPEEFPVVLTVFMAMGAWRLSRFKVLVRHPSAIERLGAISALCVDKTGTLTKNQMEVCELATFDEIVSVHSSSLPKNVQEILEFGVLASHRDPFDPMEKAIRRLVDGAAWRGTHLHPEWELVNEYPLSKKLFAMSCVWKTSNVTDQYVVACKGAPEAVAELCHLPNQHLEKLAQITQKMASKGLRVLGVAKAKVPAPLIPTEQHDFDFERVGLIGLEDPIRPEVPDAVRQCREAGIRVIMMTGDYPETALQIARRAGFDTDGSVILGRDLKSLSDEALVEHLKTTNVFARMIPEEKLRIVNILKKMGFIVGMTGDGVNDAPSLKWADVGIAMGNRGTDVAREASDIVLLDDNFASIVGGIERGRLIFSNLKKAMSYIVSIHIPIAGLAILPVLFGWPFILLPAHIVFLELIIDPVCSLMFEAQESTRNLMKSPPRNLDHRLFDFQNLINSFFQGFFVMLVVAVIFWLNISPDDPLKARTISFAVLVLSNLSLIIADISGGSFSEIKGIFKGWQNRLIISGIGICLFLGIQVRWLSNLFKFRELSLTEFILIITIAAAVFVAISSWSLVFGSRNK